MSDDRSRTAAAVRSATDAPDASRAVPPQDVPFDAAPELFPSTGGGTSDRSN